MKISFKFHNSQTESLSLNTPKNSYFSFLKPNKRILTGLKNASFLSIGNIISQAVGFLGFIYIARLLGPKDYGIYTTVLAFVSMFSLLTFPGINTVVLREGSKNLKNLAQFLNDTSGLKNTFAITSIIICIGASFLAPYPSKIKIYIIIFSTNLFYESFRGFLGSVFKASEKMEYNAGLGIFNRVIFVSLSLLLLYLGYRVLAIFFVAIFANLLTLLLSFKFTKRFVTFKLWNKVNFNKQLLTPAFIFSLIYFIGFLATKVDLLMISLLGNIDDVGIYGVAYNIVRRGVLLKSLISTAFFPVIVKRFNKSTVSFTKFLSYSGILGGAVLFLAFIVSFFSDDIIITLFGQNYTNSGPILGVLVFYLVISYSSILISNSLIATNNENKVLIFNIIAAGLNIPLNYVLFLKFGVIGIAYSTLIVYGASALSMYFIGVKALKKQGYLS